MTPFAAVAPTRAEVAERRAEDGLVTPADVVMDRAFDLPAPPAEVWPWLAQLGKGRAGWYLPFAVERWLPRRFRARRRLDPRWTTLRPGEVIPDYGGADATFTVEEVEPPHRLVYVSTRGHTHVSWTILVRPTDHDTSRVLLRLRLAPVRHVRLAETVGGAFDLLTIAGMAAGLRDRLRAPADHR